MLHIAWIVSLGDHNIKKISVENFGFRAAQGEKLNKQVVYRPIHEAIIGQNSHFASWARVLTVPRRGYRRQKTSLRILVGIYCHNMPTHTPESVWHGVIEVAKTANIAKMAERCINCMSAHLTPPHTNPMESGPGNTFSGQNPKQQKDS